MERRKPWVARVTGAAAALAAAGLIAPAQAVERTLVDRPAPEVDARLINGKMVRTKDLRGKVVVKMFWATWSPAARADLPNIDRLYREHAARGLQVIAYAIDEDPGEVRRFWKNTNYAVGAAIRDDNVFDRYGRVSTTPLYYVIDRRGVVRHRLAGPIGAEKLESVVRPLLDEAI